jgi:hypothetical protein
VLQAAIGFQGEQRGSWESWERRPTGFVGYWESWERRPTGFVGYYIGRGRWACPIGSLATQAAMTDSELANIPTLLATVILAAIQGGLVLSQPERSAWPLEATLDSALAPLPGASVTLDSRSA